jgi:hypothetical protein
MTAYREPDEREQSVAATLARTARIQRRMAEWEAEQERRNAVAESLEPTPAERQARQERAAEHDAYQRRRQMAASDRWHRQHRPFWAGPPPTPGWLQIIQVAIVVTVVLIYLFNR